MKLWSGGRLGSFAPWFILTHHKLDSLATAISHMLLLVGRVVPKDFAFWVELETCICKTLSSVFPTT